MNDSAANASPAVVTLAGVSSSYGKKLALDGIDLTLPRGLTIGLIGPDGVPVLALYKMQLQADGTWRIDGCSLAALSDKAA